MTTAITVEYEGEIGRSRNDVFSFVSDRQRLPAWSAGIKRVRPTSPGPVGVGTTYVVVGKLLGRSVESHYEVTGYERDATFAGRMRSPLFTFEERYRFDDTPTGTRLRLHAEAVPHGLLRLLGPLVAVAMQRQIRTDHGRLKTALERARPRPPGPVADAGEPPGEEGVAVRDSAEGGVREG
ncbi:MAG: SRPBCC family protein [Actinomycetota bacterium]|nr:SRPBCC family protein [Actinomycetota bacterium]